MTLITEYPSWFIVFCIITGLLFCLLLYYRNPLDAELKRPVRYGLAVLRFLSSTVLAFLLLGPFIKSVFNEVEKPIIVFAQDNSASVKQSSFSVSPSRSALAEQEVNYEGEARDSAWLAGRYRSEVEKMIEKFGNDYEIRFLSFGSKVTEGIDFSFNDKQTSLSQLLEAVEQRFANRNLGAVVIASDGIYNAGSNPVYYPFSLTAPVFTIALGDTAVRKDIIIDKVNFNRIAYLGNYFPLEILVSARQCASVKTNLEVSMGDEILVRKEIEFTGGRQSLFLPVKIKAAAKGLQRYHIEVQPVDGEVSRLNNVRDVFVNILDSRQKILILANSPHPDIAALRQAIESSENYETESELANEFTAGTVNVNGKELIQKYNLVILHQLPSVANNISGILQEIAKANIPVLFIAGMQSSIPNFNNLNACVTISGSGSKVNDVQPLLVPRFNLFTMSNGLENLVSHLPPLKAPFGSYRVLPQANVLFSQKIGMVTTENPLLAFAQSGNAKTCVITGEGLWRWRLYDYMLNRNNNAFDELINKIVQYLSAKADKTSFRIISKNTFYENEPVQMDAEVYNQSYELITEPEVTIAIINGEGKKFPFTFTRTANSYHLNTGSFPPGEYHYYGRVKNGEKIFENKGVFVISPLYVESVNTIADHRLLFALARKFNGEMMYPSGMENLPEKIIKRKDVKPVSYLHKDLKELINLKWLCYTILITLCAEWFIRKWSGTY